MEKSSDEIRKALSDIFKKLMETNESERAYLESQTVKQSKSVVWHEMRRGRIMASIMHLVMCAKIDRPAPSTILTITSKLYSSSKLKAGDPRQYGKENEKVAISEYKEFLHDSGHVAVHITEIGMNVHPDFPFIGASPDALVQCDCCGSRLLEVKCPKSHEYDPESVIFEDKNFALTKDGDNIRMKENHKYFYQVQTQMMVFELDTCDFVVWGRNAFILCEVQKNDTICADITKKSCQFFRQCILPELYTRRLEKEKSESKCVKNDTEEKEYCICGEVWDENTLMIGCDNDKCTVQWYHLPCVGLKKGPPDGQPWFCKSCKSATPKRAVRKATPKSCKQPFTSPKPKASPKSCMKPPTTPKPKATPKSCKKRSTTPKPKATPKQCEQPSTTPKPVVHKATPKPLSVDLTNLNSVNTSTTEHSTRPKRAKKRKLFEDFVGWDNC